MRISDWSSDVCSSDLRGGEQRGVGRRGGAAILAHIGGIFGEAEQPREDQRGAVEMLHRLASVAPVAEAHRIAAAEDELGQPLVEIAPLADLFAPIEDGARDAVHRARSEERRVGQECVSTCRCRWATYT